MKYLIIPIAHVFLYCIICISFLIAVLWTFKRNPNIEIIGVFNIAHNFKWYTKNIKPYLLGDKIN